MSTMQGVVLPGDSTVEHVTVPVPEPGPGQVLLRVRASSICGSDIRAIYREHLGHGAEAYQGVIAGHEPCGEVVGLGAGSRRLVEGDRVVVYHIAGCGMCDECRRGYEVGCHSPHRAAHGWQRDGGHAEFLLAEERSCILLPEPLTFVDGALVSCGFGTAYEGLRRADVSGRDRLLVTGLGPVGLAACMLGRAMGATEVIGMDVVPERVELARRLGLVDGAVTSSDDLVRVVRECTGDGVEVAIDCSGNPQARELALRSTRPWGRTVFVGEGGDVTFAVSDLLIHKQIQLHGSWVTSVLHMEELLAELVRWELHPDVIVTDILPLSQAARAYELADGGRTGKVCLVTNAPEKSG
ncbi:zinc-dependent alcohol dehydrogenase family protein [Luteipulveratus mongoliensis]|uniref:Alcohol dehydrogenase n=1 Tax=Luteipulveratus mongoliensis TaxID=571913 RepID=A0A0K1JIX9_9MICO|nr:zinc-binding dehydrogenase [Luteipulveratus mongoliensis]AKU16661.1 alcohol dehydrogenase [Luteipulveratus mongoliensis]